MDTEHKFERNDQAAGLNKVFYNMAAEIYEEADGRRGDPPLWFVDNIAFQDVNDADIFIDIGAGTGYAANIARSFYETVYALDISDKMLEKIDDKNIVKIPCDITKGWPLQEHIRADKIACISTLHHIPDFVPVLEQVDKFIARGGIFYTDLDIDRDFVKMWSCPLKLYRSLRAPAKRYAKLLCAIPEAVKEIYDQVEVHSQGNNTRSIRKWLEDRGWLVEITYHWGRYRKWPRGMAPFASIWAEK